MHFEMFLWLHLLFLPAFYLPRRDTLEDWPQAFVSRVSSFYYDRLYPTSFSFPYSLPSFFFVNCFRIFVVSLMLCFDHVVWVEHTQSTIVELERLQQRPLSPSYQCNFYAAALVFVGALLDHYESVHACVCFLPTFSVEVIHLEENRVGKMQSFIFNSQILFKPCSQCTVPHRCTSCEDGEAQRLNILKFTAHLINIGMTHAIHVRHDEL